MIITKTGPKIFAIGTGCDGGRSKCVTSVTANITFPLSAQLGRKKQNFSDIFTALFEEEFPWSRLILQRTPFEVRLNISFTELFDHGNDGIELLRSNMDMRSVLWIHYLQCYCVSQHAYSNWSFRGSGCWGDALKMRLSASERTKVCVLLPDWCHSSWWRLALTTISTNMTGAWPGWWTLCNASNLVIFSATIACFAIQIPTQAWKQLEFAHLPQSKKNT